MISGNTELSMLRYGQKHSTGTVAVKKYNADRFIYVLIHFYPVCLTERLVLYYAWLFHNLAINRR